MDRLTRKELKSDRFALEVQHSVEYVSEHRKQLIRWGGLGLAVIVLAVAFFIYRSYQHSARQAALRDALQISNAAVGPAGNPNVKTFNTAEERSAATNKAFGDIAAKYSGTEEGVIAQFSLAVNASDDGKTAEAERRFKEVVDSGNDQYGSLARLSLAQLYASEGKTADGAKLIQYVIDHPTILVSKEQATIALAELIMKSDPAQARTLLEPLRTNPRPNINGKPNTLLSEMQNQK